MKIKLKQHLHQSTQSTTNVPVVPPLNTTTVIAKADSGATRHYFRATDATVLKNQQDDSSGPTVTLPDNTTITATKKGEVPLSTKLTTKATTAHVLNDLQSASLISLGQLCDDDCEVQLSKTNLKVYKDNEVIITGEQNQQDGLWDIPLIKRNSKLRQHLNVILVKNKTKQQLASYLHSCCFSPSIRTFVKAVKMATSYHGQV